jgi:cytochrome c553
VNVDELNKAGALRDDFLLWVKDNAPALDARTLLLADRFRGQSVRVTQGVQRIPLSLAGLDATVAGQFPQLRQQVELVGCSVCHTADADFVQTHSDRTVSKFYEKELKERERQLEKLTAGQRPAHPFGPLQPNPVLPE